MRLAILSSPACHMISDVYENSAHPRGLTMLLSDRVANGESFPEERVVRLPRRFTKRFPHWSRDAAERELRGGPR